MKCLHSTRGAHSSLDGRKGAADVLADYAADKEMWRISGQGLAPVIDVDGQILADFDVAQLTEFWKRFE